MKNFLKTFLVILIIAILIALYPWKVQVKNGEATCENLLGMKMNCRR